MALLQQLGARGDVLQCKCFCSQSAAPRASFFTGRKLSRCSTQSMPRRFVATRGLLDSLRDALQLNKSHAPELVRIDMDSDGGLGGTSEHLFGPLAVAMIGFQPMEVDSFRAFMNDMEADMVTLICCTQQQMRQSLQQVLEGPTPDVKEPAVGVRRAIVLSGMSGEEVSEVIGAYNDSGLPETVWAAAVPMNYTRRLEDLVQDIYGDHMYLKNNPDAAPR